jgi:hypothetical protein
MTAQFKSTLAETPAHVFPALSTPRRRERRERDEREKNGPSDTLTFAKTRGERGAEAKLELATRGRVREAEESRREKRGSERERSRTEPDG